jgi:hypothetical protein
VIEHNSTLGFISHLSTWTISVWVTYVISTYSLSSFSLMLSRCLAISTWPSVSMLISLSRPNKLSSITPRVYSHKFLTSLAHSLLSDIFRSHAFSKMLPLVCSGMESLELLFISFFIVAITTSWKMTRTTPTSLSLKEKSFST